MSYGFLSFKACPFVSKVLNKTPGLHQPTTVPSQFTIILLLVKTPVLQGVAYI